MKNKIKQKGKMKEKSSPLSSTLTIKFIVIGNSQEYKEMRSE